MTRVKICGVRTPEDAADAVWAGADAVGVILAPAPRRISLADVTAIRRAFPALVPLVGVFVDPGEHEVRVALDAGVGVLQFSGVESPQFCASFGRPFIKVLHVGERAPELGDVRRYSAGMITFDAASVQRGGMGRTFAWSAIEPLREIGPFCVAGGLRPENVGEAVRRLRPFAVDVSSGVERGGRKDRELMRAFVRAVRESDAAA
ncbi:phosphoribosylanthranilate isomerase [bacterium]|nr:MAG: phosphoribosylanthranilate isomerase [bacterium]